MFLTICQNHLVCMFNVYLFYSHVDMFHPQIEFVVYCFFFFQAEDGIRDIGVTGVQTCALPIYERQRKIVDVLVDAFSELMAADPDAFRNKFRKMAAGPFAFYRGSAPLFYADMEGEEDRWADDRTSRVWIQGDLHAENFGTYMAGDGVFVFDVNAFDEAYLGHFTWDIKRMAASVALLGWMKAISDDNIASLIETYVRAYLQQVHYFVYSDRDHEYSLRLETTDGNVRKTLLETRLNTRIDLLDRTTLVDEDFDRRFPRGPGVRELDDAERARGQAAYESYFETIPQAKRFRSLTYQGKDRKSTP